VDSDWEPRTLDVLTHVNATHGLAYRFVRRLAGGMQSGASELRDPDGRRAVLKWSTDRSWAEQVVRAGPAVERARAAGWPTPRWLAVGVTPDGHPYHVQEFVDGQPMGRLDPARVRQLLDLVDGHEGLDPDPERNWSQWVTDVVFDGRDDARDGARRVDASAAGLVDRFDELCEQYRGVKPPAADLVHGDLNPGNVLVAGGRIVGVIDVEAVGSGTRAFDLTALLRTAYAEGTDGATRAALRRAALAAAGPAGVVLCAAAGFFTATLFVARRDRARLPAHYAATARLLDDLVAGGPPRVSRGAPGTARRTGPPA
jgi:aminoglycoside phosphotransferase (APT) family kinase protein